MQSRISTALLGSVMALLPAALASANVSLVLTNTAAPSSVTVARGGSFPVSIKLNSTSAATADQATAVDYFLKASTSNIFTLTSRNSQTVASAFPAVYVPDGSASITNVVLNPSESTDLGGSVTNVNVPVDNGTFEVADYLISVAANAPAGNYTLSTFSNPGTGYAGPSPTFPDTVFTNQGSYSITVAVPEPATITVLALGILALGVRRTSHKRFA